MAKPVESGGCGCREDPRAAGVRYYPAERVKLDLSHAQRWQSLALPYLFERGGIDPGRPALIFKNRHRSYGELRDMMRRVAHALIDLGIQSVDRVALLSTNRLEYLEIEAGIAAACAIMVPMNWRLRPQELAAILRRSGARAIIVEPAFAGVIAELRDLGEVPELEIVIRLDGGADDPMSFETLTAAADSGPVPRLPHFEDPHEIIFTSGTTGLPKGVVWTNGGLFFNSLQQVIDYRLGPEHSTYAAIDLYYIGGRHDFTWPILHAGGVVHIKESSGFNARAVLKYVCDHKITHVLWVPTMVYEILRVPDIASFDARHIRMIMCGGAPVSVETVQAMQQKFPSSDFVQVYGLTEGGGSVTCMSAEAAIRKPGSAGRPSVHVTLRIVDGEGCDVPANTDGEIWVRAPSVTAGYWDDPQLTEETFVGDWLRTGDVGRLDEDGYLFVTGRKKDMIISGGMNIFPSEIEDILRTFPGVGDVSVIGVPHDKWGEQVCAVIELISPHQPSEQDVIDYCVLRLAGFKKPSLVRFVSALPRTSSGKPQKFELRKMFAGLQ